MRRCLVQKIKREAALCLATCCLVLTSGCAPSGPQASAKKPDEKLAPFVLNRLPDTVEHSTYLDFGGKVQLVGYDISPSDVARPGSSISLTLYWQRTGTLDKGWGLFTHILDERGRQIAQRDSSGPLREPGAEGGQALGPSDWQIGKIYVDKLEFDVPRTQQKGGEQVPLQTEAITIAVGVWKDAARLDVLGGSSDAHRRGFVTHLKTGVKREASPKKAAERAPRAERTKDG